MQDQCVVCERPCLPGQDLLRCIPVTIDHTGKRMLAADPWGDLTIHRACLGAPRATAKAPSAPGVAIERADLFDFLA